MDADRSAAAVRDKAIGGGDPDRCFLAEPGAGERNEDREQVGFDRFEGQRAEEDADERDGERNDDVRRNDLHALQPERRHGNDGLRRDAGDQQPRASRKRGAEQCEAPPPIARITATERRDRKREREGRAGEEDRVIELNVADPAFHAAGRLEQHMPEQADR